MLNKPQVERRVGDSAFTVSELCSLIRLLSLGARGDVDVTRNVWIHLGSRYKDIDATNIANVYCAMRYVTPDVQYLWKILEKQLKVTEWIVAPMHDVFVRIDGDHFWRNIAGWNGEQQRLQG